MVDSGLVFEGSILHKLFYIRPLPKWYRNPASISHLLGQILCQAVDIPRDCARDLLANEHHQLIFFTNHRIIQVYCYHNTAEKQILRELIKSHLEFERELKGESLNGQSYEQFTEKVFWKSRPLLAWESIFPDGIDMEALEPRDANVRIRVKPQVQQKAPAPAAKLGAKEKDHPPPPPAQVQEPPSSDRPNGAIYHTGKLLGKGGFAICYEGQQAGTKHLVALKIVKSSMAQKKMEMKFQTELQIHSKMKHVNIVQFHRAFSYDKCTYLVLELCPNGSLMDMVKTRKFITEPEVRFWTVQMAGAIKYMHAKGIIHRDLKMGNIFLDKDMNVKVGDFGLAALLMSSRDMNACRRTTLCGTPNYIAPEILEKNKGGHDHAVDIWSLGIIIFAMLTGKPPFQSTTQDEIYRRAREREYDWPKLDTSENFISDETKDLVSSLLQGPDERPDPDIIVQHPFFTCGWVPQADEITRDLRTSAPRQDQFLSAGVKTGKSNVYFKNLKKLCMKCEVGPWNTSPRRHASTYKEVAAEEKAGLTPIVPLPEDVVYRPFDEWLREEAEKLERPGMDAEVTKAELLDTLENQAPTRRNEQQLPSSSRMSTQSYAAQQRARPQGYALPPSRTARLVQPDIKAPGGSRVAESSSRPLLSIPSRHAKPISKKDETRLPEKNIEVENRLAADLANQLNNADSDRKLVKDTPAFVPLEGYDASLFSPLERVEPMAGTKPPRILDGLRRLQTELERALNSRSLAPTPDDTPLSPPIVVKWVDYTNKFGLGYILSNGSVGCIFKEAPAFKAHPSRGNSPTSCVVVRDAETHLRNRNNKEYADRLQLVPIQGSDIEFYENRAEDGIWRSKINPQSYVVTINKQGEANKLTRGIDDYDTRKRDKIVVWRKFGAYMTAFGRDEDYLFDDALSRTKPESMVENVAAVDVATFYQRFGDVGCWGFCDGHFQFNFPDHTKIILSADGTWCDFYHLPLEAARDLANNGTFPASALDDRQRLSYPLQTLLNFMNKKQPKTGKTLSARRRPEIDPMIQGIPQANDFRRKVDFIRQVVKEWVSMGGLGRSDMEPKTRLRWTGYRELVNVSIPYKQVWTTVGGRCEEERRTAWFDPRKPGADIPDID